MSVVVVIVHDQTSMSCLTINYSGWTNVAACFVRLHLYHTQRRAGHCFIRKPTKMSYLESNISLPLANLANACVSRCYE
jgi:hypothetical protein